MDQTIGNGSVRVSCPAIVEPWTLWSTVGLRPSADTCGRATSVGTHTMSPTPAAIAAAQEVIASPPKPGSKRDDRHSYRSPPVHVVCTVPHELGAIIRRHQQDLYDLLFRAASQSLIKLAADPHDVGGLSGALGVLQTWTRTLVYPPPVHGLVPAGGISADRTEWRPARSSSRVPVHALSKLLRGRFRDL